MQHILFVQMLSDSGLCWVQGRRTWYSILLTPFNLDPHVVKFYFGVTSFLELNLRISEDKILIENL